jgi:phosphoglycolate phosphatase-like HAD superfamily hydrolase
LWLLSKRNDESETPIIVENYGFQHIITPQKTGNYMEIKSDGLAYVKRQVPTNSIVVYVGDRAEDFVVALSSRVIFCSPSALSEEIFRDVKVGFATLCGGECGRKAYFEGHLTGMI